jgi:hypothetical protein
MAPQLSSRMADDTTGTLQNKRWRWKCNCETRQRAFAALTAGNPEAATKPRNNHSGVRDQFVSNFARRKKSFVICDFLPRVGSRHPNRDDDIVAVRVYAEQQAHRPVTARRIVD